MIKKLIPLLTQRMQNWWVWGQRTNDPALSRRCSNQLSYRPKVPMLNHCVNPFLVSSSTTDKCDIFNLAELSFLERR